MALLVFICHVSPEKQPKAKRPLLLGVVATVLIALALGVWIGSWLWEDTHEPTVLMANAYHMLERGQPLEAEVLFKPLLSRADKGVKSQGYVGMAAVAFVRSDYAQSLDLTRQAEALDPEVVYSHVLRGNILLHQGKTAEAAAAYRTALEKSHGFSWQRTMAHNRLGRIYAAEGDVQQALVHYDRAMSQPPQNGPQETALACANKAHLLAQQGRPEEALALYRQAQQLNPDDRLIAALLREAEHRVRSAQDKERQERIDALVAELLQIHRDGRPQPEQGDGWTSSPLTLAFLPMQARGTLSARAGEEDFLFLRLADALQATGRIVVVERDLLEKILAELKLSNAELISPQVSARLGHILAARLLATGSIVRLGTAAQLSLRVIETESTRLKAAVTEIIELPLEIESVAEQFSAALLPKLRAAYPLQGRIVQAAPDSILLNIGAAHGVRPGLRLEVFGAEEPKRLEGRLIG
jgi:tetratricopeptide (TPR) repeat protein